MKRLMVAVALTLGQQQPQAAPGVVRADIANPDYHCKLAVQHLSTVVPKADWPYTRFVSLYHLQRPAVDFRKRPLEIFARASSDGEAQRLRRVLSWWVQQLSFETFATLPREVPGSDGRLLRLDIRDYRWTAAGWAAVAERDPYFGEPWVEHEHAEFLRNAVGYGVPDKLVKQKRFPIIAVVRADFLFRDTIETDRSTSYYDLLFSQQRFAGGAKRKVERIYDHPGGPFRYPDGSFGPVAAPGKYRVEADEPGDVAFVDFPKDETDWQKAFGIDQSAKFLREQKLNLRAGAIVPGSRDDPIKGSIVALNNRVVELHPTPTGRDALKTFDAKETAGQRDFLEKSPEVAVGDITTDAGELLAPLPNGGQAGLLIDGKGKRLEIAATTFAHNKVDSRFIDVRTFHGCMACHGPDSGFIMPRSLTEEMLKEGIDVRIKDRAKLLAFKAFFSSLDARAKAWRGPYEALIQQTTKDARGQPWKPAELTRAFLQERDRYDDPVTPQRAADELGVPVGVLKLVAVKSPLVRLNKLVQGQAIPRRVWEAEIYREAALILTYERYPQRGKK